MKTIIGHITSPTEHQKIGSKIRIEGLIENMDKNKDLWIVHRRNEGDKFWPKEPMISLDKNDRFELITHEGGAPGLINISLILVEKSVSEMFNYWLSHGHKNNHYPGISPNIKGIHELDNVDVFYNSRKPLKLFYSYSHKDEEYMSSLQENLASLERQGLIESWCDVEINAGQRFNEKILNEMEVSDIMLLLISPSFIASDYCYNIELKTAFEKEIRVIPIILRPSDWQNTEIGTIKVLPKDGKPITTWNNIDEAWLDVANGIRKVINELR